ncbi:MAG: PAS domain S-box-containing protein, partial [Haloarculaceae archaeon]
MRDSLLVALVCQDQTDRARLRARGRGNTGPDGGDGHRVRTDGGTAARDDPPESADEAIEQITDGFVTLDADWQVTYVNEAGREMLGASAGELVGESIWTTLPEEETELSEQFERTRAAGEVTTREEFDPHRDRWFEVRAYPAGNGLSVFLRDITERKRTREELQASEQSLHQLHELASDSERSREEKIAQMLAVGRERLGVDLGFLTHIEAGTQEIVESVGDHPELEPGSSAPLSEAYCRHTLGRKKPLSVVDAATEGWTDDPAYERFGLSCYIGATIYVDGEQFGTLCFGDRNPRQADFTESERTFVDLLTDWVSYILEQREYEHRLRAKQRRLETVTENVPVVMFALDPEGTYTLIRGRGLAALGFEPGQAVGESIFDLYADHPDVLDHARRALDGEQTQQTVELGSGVTLEVWYQPVVEDGTVQQVVGVARDVTELYEHRQRLSGLLETTRSLMQARDREEVAEIAATATQEVLGFPLNVMRLYDADADTLVPAGKTAAAEAQMGERPVYDVGEGLPGEVFATGESRLVEDVEADRVDGIQSAIYYPVGMHGTISVGSTERAAFDESDEQVLALLATVAAAACTRAERERQVREAREHVETILERVNGLVENTIEVLVAATTRENLEVGVVDQLARADPYTAAWLGRPDVASETLSPTEWAGDPPVALDDATFPLDGDGPVATALETGRPQVVACDDPAADTLGCTPESPAETCLIVPLTYKDTTYGIEVVFADEAGAFDEREQAVLTALGRAVANAINAIERGRILDATEVIELEFVVADSDLLFSRLSQGGDCTVSAADIDYRADGTLRLYLTSEDGDGERLVELAREIDAVSEASLITDHEDGCLLEVSVETSLVAQLGEFGAVVRNVVATDGQTRFTVELPYEAEAREVFGLVDDQYAETDLVAYHEHERPVQTRQEFRAAVSDRFT